MTEASHKRDSSEYPGSVLGAQASCLPPLLESHFRSDSTLNQLLACYPNAATFLIVSERNHRIDLRSSTGRDETRKRGNGG